MSRLAHFLRRESYAIENWGYRSTTSSIETHAKRFFDRFRTFAADDCLSCIHVVTHSMGGIIARRAFRDAIPAKLGRVVMLGPPNGGSHVARRLSGTLGIICPPLKEFSDEPDSYVNELDEPSGIEVGVIAAALDRVVKLSSTSLACQPDYIVVPGHHGTLPWRRDTAEQVAHFLRLGSFKELATAHSSSPADRAYALARC